MKKFLISCAALMASTGAQAAEYVETFETTFPAWESGWFKQKSNAQNVYGNGQGRGNNPDGLWLSTGATDQSINLRFVSDFATSLLSFDMDIASFGNRTLTFYDAAGKVLSTTTVASNNGAYTDPGTYGRYGVTSTTGISGFTLSAGSAGNLSVDNLRAVTRDAVSAVPEPATWAMMLVGFGAIGAGMRRRRQTVRVHYA